MAWRYTQTYAHIQDIRVERKEKVPSSDWIQSIMQMVNRRREEKEGNRRSNRKTDQDLFKEKAKKGYVFSASYSLTHVYVLYVSVNTNVFWQGIQTHHDYLSTHSFLLSTGCASL